MMYLARVWAPFAIALEGCWVVLAFDVQLAAAMPYVYDPWFGYLPVYLSAGGPIGAAAAIISRTWRGVLTFVLGFLVAGQFYGLVDLHDLPYQEPDPFDDVLTLLLFPPGLSAVPTYLVVTAAIFGLRWLIAYGRRRSSVAHDVEGVGLDT